MPALGSRLIILIHPNMRGSDVVRCQEYLRFAAAQRDGIYGPITETAVTQFQYRHGLGADGIVGPITIAAWRAGKR